MRQQHIKSRTSLKVARSSKRSCNKTLPWSRRHNEEAFHFSQWRRPYQRAADSWIIEEEARLPIWAEPKKSVSFWWSRQLARRNCWDRGVWWQDMPKYWLCSSVCSTKDKTLVRRELIFSRKQHDFEKYAEDQPTEARLSPFFRKPLGMDLLFQSLQGSSNR